MASTNRVSPREEDAHRKGQVLVKEGQPAQRGRSERVRDPRKSECYSGEALEHVQGQVRSYREAFVDRREYNQ